MMNKNWQDEFRSAIKSYSEIKDFFNLDADLEKIPYSVFLPKKFAYKIKHSGKNSALWKQFIPQLFENDEQGFLDPIGDIKSSKGHGIIQKYHNRILFTPTTNCPVICRYCFRKNQLSNQDEIFKQNLNFLSQYLHENTHINEVILTGGDPLILNEQKLATLLETLLKSQVKFVRIHTRTPIILPSRINKDLVNLLKQYSSKFTRFLFVLHTNHPDELDIEVSSALKLLTEIPKIDLLTQSVLLKGVNDSYINLHDLIFKIIEIGFTPYYLHHPDKAKGAMHFYLPLETGRKIYNKLRGDLPGWAIPHYIIDNNDGHGKQLAFNPETYHFSGNFLNYKDL